MPKDLLLEQDYDGQDDDADDDGRVCDVEDGPDAEIDKIGHLPEPNAVDKVAGASRYLEGKADAEEDAGGAELPEEVEHNGDSDEGADYKEEGLVGEETEGATGVFGVGQAHPPMLWDRPATLLRSRGKRCSLDRTRTADWASNLAYRAG